MNIKIYLDTTILRNKGYPVCIYLYADKKKKITRIRYYSFLENWNKDNNEPNKSHPNYSHLINETFALKKVKKILIFRDYFSIFFWNYFSKVSRLSKIFIPELSY